MAGNAENIPGNVENGVGEEIMQHHQRALEGSQLKMTIRCWSVYDLHCSRRSVDSVAVTIAALT